MSSAELCPFLSLFIYFVPIERQADEARRLKMMSLLHCCVKLKEGSGTARGYRFRGQEGSELCEEEGMRGT